MQTPDGKRQGFFLGDGTGVGKGRTISGIIYDYYCSLCDPSQVDIYCILHHDHESLLPFVQRAGKSKSVCTAASKMTLPTGKVFRCIWVSTAWDLHADAIRDFLAVTMTASEDELPFNVKPLNQVSAGQACIFISYIHMRTNIHVLSSVP